MNNTPKTEPAKRLVSFAAIDTYVERNIISPRATLVTGDDRYRWGDRDLYPSYLAELYDTVTTLGAVIDGCTDFVAGDDVAFEGQKDRVLNSAGETAPEIVRQLAHNASVYGGFAIDVIRNKVGGIAEIYAVDLKYLRTNKDNSVFWYSEKWTKFRPEPEILPAFMPNLQAEWASLTDGEKNFHASSILWVKLRDGDVYPAPPYAAAVKACEIERCIDDYHLNNLDNGFAPSAIINFNNGVPEDDEKKEIEKTFSEKFGGHYNAGRLMFAFNPDKENAVTVEYPKVEDFGARYDALAKRSRQAIFTAFRANPNLFGIPTESLGFSSEEYKSAFKLFNRTQIRPIQRKISDAFAKVYGAAVLTIVPFTLDGAGEAAVS